jgi:hypothetical protein
MGKFSNADMRAEMVDALINQLLIKVEASENKEDNEILLKLIIDDIGLNNSQKVAIVY